MCGLEYVRIIIHRLAKVFKLETTIYSGVRILCMLSMSSVTNTPYIVVIILGISIRIIIITIVITISINLVSITIIIFIISSIYYCSCFIVLMLFSSYEDCNYEFV